MPIANDPTGNASSGPFAELLRLQTDFQARLADETFRYLRRLHGTLGPGAPGTVARPTTGLALRAEVAPGGRAALRVAIENRQRVHCVVAPHLTTLLGAGGVAWIPATDPPLGSRLVAPGATDTVELTLDVPRELPVGRYRGALLLAGFVEGAVPIEIVVQQPSTSDTASDTTSDADAAPNGAAVSTAAAPGAGSPLARRRGNAGASPAPAPRQRRTGAGGRRAGPDAPPSALPDVPSTAAPATGPAAPPTAPVRRRPPARKRP